ncbi:MAG: hypothetical protein JSR66_17750 [Proteobacteria bacterium]|nr:hypothetical protein [Pseudomonadota bacterium]
MTRGIGVTGLALLASTALAGSLAKDTTVRIEGSGIEIGWHNGKIMVTHEGCTMIRLQTPTRKGYTMIALIATDRLQRQEGSTWVDVSVEDLRKAEPKRCLEEGAD